MKAVVAVIKSDSLLWLRRRSNISELGVIVPAATSPRSPSAGFGASDPYTHVIDLESQSTPAAESQPRAPSSITFYRRKVRLHSYSYMQGFFPSTLTNALHVSFCCIKTFRGSCTGSSSWRRSSLARSWQVSRGASTTRCVACVLGADFYKRRAVRLTCIGCCYSFVCFLQLCSSKFVADTFTFGYILIKVYAQKTHNKVIDLYKRHAY